MEKRLSDVFLSI